MKELLKKYWYIPTIIVSLILIIVLPIGINKILLKPAPYEVVGNSETWLAFWSTYLGTIIGSFITLIVLFMTLKQNEANNKESKELQINIYKKGLEERRIQELAQTFKESLHFINYPQIQSNHILIQNQDYVDANTFFSSESSKCIDNISSYKLDFINTDKDKSIDDYRDAFGEILVEYIIFINTTLIIIKVLQKTDLTTKIACFKHHFNLGTQKAVIRKAFTQNEYNILTQFKDERLFINEIKSILNNRYTQFSNLFIKNHSKLGGSAIKIITSKKNKLRKLFTINTHLG